MKTKSTIFKFIGSLVLALFLWWGSALSVSAQLQDLDFTSSAGTYTEITGGTLIGSAGPGVGADYLDDVTFQDLPIPFTFAFNGNNYTNFNLNTNGFLTFGNVFTNSYSPISATTAYAGVIAAFANDLDGRFTTQAMTTAGSNTLTGVLHFGGVIVGKAITGTNIPAGTTITAFDAGAQTITLSQAATVTSSALVTIQVYTGELRYETLGVAPNRVHVIQVKNFKRFGSGSTIYNGELVNFQIRLHETTNNIEFVYGDYSVTSSTARTTQVGLRGATNADFVNRATVAPHDWSATTAGTLNNSTSSFLNTGYPASGLTFLYETPPPPAFGNVAGIVKDAASGEPVIGAHVMTGDLSVVTLADGSYMFEELEEGPNTVTVHKAGYNTLEQIINIIGGQTVNQDLMLMESANVPGPVLAELNSGATAVNISWGLPQGLYEIIYDDGVADNVTAWGLGGNYNALRFTPAGYPVNIVSGSVNIYDGTYPPGGNPLVPFQMAVYDATGPGGYPGTELGVVDVDPDDTGWVSFDLSGLDITITSGDFYLVMIQGGNFPNCAPIAIDNTNPVMRSYSRFVTGGAPWTPAGFNDFMMRAIVQGPGGPEFLSYSTGELVESSRISEGALFLHAPQRAIAEVGMGIFKPIENTGVIDRNVLGYRVYRLVEGQESNMAAWTLLGEPTGTTLVDNSWPGLPDGAYRWAVQAKYPGNVFSEPTFSNVLRKNWDSNVTITVALSDPNVTPSGIQVGLTNTAFPQYTYNASTNDDGVVNFPEVWKGNYDLVVYKFGYDPYLANLDIMTGTFTHNVMLLETTYPPSALYVDPVMIHATWVAPGVSLDLLEENWGSGGFAANEWTFDPAQGNWQMDASFGNPAPSARFYWSPSVTNYNTALVSKQLSGLGMPSVMLKYDLYLDNYSSATLEQMAVEVWNGSSWVGVANYSNAGGDIPFTTYTHNITQHAQGQQFKVRFRAYGANSFNINWWNLDNIMVYGEVADGGDRSVLGYFVYLDDIVAGFTTETSFQYQPEYVNYGQTYTAGVQAVYESGISDIITYEFTSLFLYPPCNLEGEDVGHAVALTWEAPGTCDPFGGSGGGGGGTGELYEIKYHNGVPLDGYYQQFNYGYGVVFDVAAYSNVTVEKADFRHSPWGVNGTWTYKLHVVDWNTHTLLHTTPVMTTTGNNTWEVDIALNSIPETGLVGVFMEPMGNIATDAYPCIDGDQQTTTSSFFGQLPNWSAMASAGPVGNFLMDLWIMADPMDGGERQLVKAPMLNGAIASNQQVKSSGDSPRVDALTLSQSIGSAESDPNAASNHVDFTDATWDVQFQYNLETITGALGNAGGETDGTHYYTTRWASNLIHKISMTGTLVEEFSIPGITGLRDLAYDGVYFYGSNATAGAGIRQLDFENKVLVSTIPCTFAVRSISYDPVADGFWINNFGDDLKLISRTGALLQTINTAPLSLYGSAYDGWTAGGPYLWLFTGTTTGGGCQVQQLSLATGTLTGVSHSVSGNIPGNGIAGGLWSHPGIVPGTVTLGGVSQGTPDMLFGFELAPYSGGGGGGPVETAGFRIYRDGAMIAEVDGETFEYVDTPLIAGTYNYTVTAIYDYEDDIVESLHEGPASVDVAPGTGFVQGIVFDAATFQPVEGVMITAGDFSTTTQANGTYTLVAYEGVYDIVFDKIGYALYIEEDFEIVWQQTHTLNVELTPQDPNFPFEETWASGSFGTQGWTFVPAQGNWRMSTSAGNPAPSAEFYWSPSATNYSNALTSVEIDARAALQNVTLTYAIYLDNYSATAAEKMTVEIWDGSEWVFVSEHKNDNDIPWTTHNFDVTQHAAGKMTRVRFRANGANSFNINWWNLDNIKLHQVLPPEISVSPTSLEQALVQGTTATQELTVSNVGAGEMNFTTQIEYLDKSNEFTVYPVEPGDKVVISGMELSAANAQPGGEPEEPRNEVILNYDGPNSDAIGLTGGGTFHVAARYPSSMVGQYAGYALTSVDVYINDVPSSATLKIWGAGTGTSPGTLLHSQAFTSTAMSWMNIELSNTLVLDGTDIWVGYEVTHGASQFPAGCDAGPANPNGDWISLNGTVWEHLAGYGLNYNWNIRARLNPGEGLWLSLSPNSGSVAPGGSLPLTVTFDATGLEVDVYTANILVNSNDPNTPQVVVPVMLDVLLSINEVDREAVMVYPVPASEVLNVATTQGITHMRMFSYTGQVVYERNVTGAGTTSIDVKPFHSGAYILQLITVDGQTFNKRVLISR
jgi:hypothetical protein